MVEDDCLSDISSVSDSENQVTADEAAQQIQKLRRESKFRTNSRFERNYKAKKDSSSLGTSDDSSEEVEKVDELPDAEPRAASGLLSVGSGQGKDNRKADPYSP